MEGNKLERDMPAVFSSHLEVDWQVPLQGDFVNQADLWFAGIATLLCLTFLFGTLGTNKNSRKSEMEKSDLPRCSVQPILSVTVREHRVGIGNVAQSFYKAFRNGCIINTGYQTGNMVACRFFPVATHGTAAKKSQGPRKGYKIPRYKKKSLLHRMTVT